MKNKLHRENIVVENQSATFEEIGKELGVTACRARQIYSSAMRKLRKKSRKEKLEQFVDYGDKNGCI